MRLLRRFAVVIFVCALVFYFYANMKYQSNVNTDKPTIKNETELLELSVTDSEDALLQGLSVFDETDGDLTKDIVIASKSHFLDDGSVNVKYVVFDSHNNSASITRKVKYNDYKSPMFLLSQPPVYYVGNSFDLLDNIKVEDCLEGDISDKVRVISNMVNNYALGVYPVVLEVSNSFGDTSQITIWVTYQSKDNTASIKLHQYIVYIEQGEEFDPYKWIASATDKQNNELDKEKIEIKGNLDTNAAGDYQLVYSYDDGKNVGQTAITVVVKERQD